MTKMLLRKLPKVTPLKFDQSVPEPHQLFCLTKKLPDPTLDVV